MPRKDYNFTEALTGEAKGMKIGIPSDYLGEGLDDEIRTAVLQGAELLKSRSQLQPVAFRRREVRVQDRGV